MTLATRARMRPVLYPAAILLAFVLNLLVDSGVSPWAAGRPLLIALAIGLGLPWLAGMVTGDRQAAGVFSAFLVLLLLLAPTPAILALGLGVLTIVTLEWSLARRRGSLRADGERLWPLLGRVLTAGALIFLVAVAIKGAQTGRLEAIAHDLAAESPFRPRITAASAKSALPDIFLVLLDGYPRADKLKSEFGIDSAGFTQALEDRGFHVATHSRSNHTSTWASLTQLFSYVPGVGSIAPEGRTEAEWRHLINEGPFFADIRRLGYVVAAVSPGFEHVVLRQADQFIDTGEPNEFEWAVLRATSAGGLMDTALPELAADLHRARVLGAFEATETIANTDAASPRFVFTHIPAPHSPLVFDRDGSPWPMRGIVMRYSDSFELTQLGRTEYVRRLDGQIAFIDTLTLDLVDQIVAADPGAVVVVFSDHGSGVDSGAGDHRASDADLRTANLLAVRSPGKTGIIDDRSTLANLLPRLLRSYAGSGPADVPETIYAWADDPNASYVFVRPD